MRSFASLAVVLGFAVVAGCSSDDESPGSGGSGGDASSASTTGTTTSSSGGGSPGDGGSGGGNANPLCSKDLELRAFGLEVTEASGNAITTSDDGAPSTVQGAVLAVEKGSTADTVVWTIDTCPPNAGCLEGVQKFSIAAPDQAVLVGLEGTFVEIRFRNYEEVLDGPFQLDNIVIRNLPSFGGIESSDTEPHLWFAGGNNIDAEFGAPFFAEAIDLECGFEANGCAPLTYYKLAFATAAGADDRVEVTMSAGDEPVYWSPGAPLSGGQTPTFAIRNFGSVGGGTCHGYPAVSNYTIQTAPL